MQIQEFGGFCLVKDQMSNEKELFRLMLLYTAPGGGVHNNLYEFPWRFLLQERPIAKQDFPSWAIKRQNTRATTHSTIHCLRQKSRDTPRSKTITLVGQCEIRKSNTESKSTRGEGGGGGVLL